MSSVRDNCKDMYYIVFFLLLFFSVIEIFKEKKNPAWFYFIYFMMTCMVMFRYGQLTDYFNYEGIYETPESAGITDPLYFLITEGLKSFGISYEGYVAILGALTMLLAYPFFSRYCHKSMTAMLIFYSYAFLILPMSAVRQGVCFAILLYCYSLLLERKKMLFYVIAGVGGFIHFSMFIVVFIALFFDKKFYNNKYVGWTLCGLTIFALITPDLSSYIPEFLSGKSLGEYEDSRLIQIVLRASIIIPVVYIKPKYGTNAYYAKAICVMGYVMYCCLAFSSTIAGRLEYYFRIFSCLFVASILFDLQKIYYRRIILGVMIIVHVALFYKNMNSFVSQADYNTNKVSMYNFPYVSIFDKDNLDQYK